MNKQNLAIYSSLSLFNILKELEDNLNITVVFISNEKELKKKISESILIITSETKLNIENILKISLPIKISKLIEKINVETIRIKAKIQSNVAIGNYNLDLNGRVLKLKSDVLDLTEKETKIINFLNDSDIPVNIKKLQTEVWGYNEQLDTHTVETHIHRLRKKLIDKFGKNNLIFSEKNGYYLNKLS